MNKAFNYKSSRTYGVHYSTPIYSKPSQSTNQTFIICPNGDNDPRRSMPNMQMPYDPNMLPVIDQQKDNQLNDAIGQPVAQVVPPPDETPTPIARRQTKEPKPNESDEIHAAIAMVLSNYIRKTSKNQYDSHDQLILTADDFCMIISTLAVVNPWDVVLSLADDDPDIECGCCCFTAKKIPEMLAKRITAIQIASNNFRPISYETLQLLARIYGFSIISVLISEMNVINKEDNE